MTSSLVTTILLWLGAYALHSTLFLGGVFLFERTWKRASPALLGSLWRTALVAGAITATVQATGMIQPLAGRLPVAVENAVVAATIVEPVPSQPATPAPIAASTADDPAAAIDAPVLNEAAGAFVPSQPNWRLDWRQGLVALWGVIASILALRAVLVWWAAHRELADRKPVVKGPLFERIQILAHDAGLRRLPQVSFSERIAGPFTLPNGEICIPVWAREKLPPQQLDAMLAHEMAHVLHRDSFWLAIGMAMGTLFFFQPLNLVARKRLAHLAELSADDWAATRAGGGRALAECISTFVDIAHTRARAKATPEFAAAMAKPKSELVQRVERLLSNRYTTGVLPMKTRLAIGACALAFATVMPGLTAQAHDQPAPPAAPAAPAAREAAALPKAAAPPQAAAAPEAAAALAATPETPASVLDPAPSPAPQRHVSISQLDGGEIHLSMNLEKLFDYRLTASANGSMDLAPDGSGVTRMSSGSFLDATLDRGGQVRRVRYTGDQGNIRREFWAGGQSRAWSPDADRFVAELMPILFRETGINANERVDWLLKQRGPDALIAEIALIDSDTVTSRYMMRWLDTATLPPQTLERLLAMASEQIDSDSQLFVTLEHAYKTQKPAGRQLALLIKAGQSIDSDSQTAALLHTLAPAALGADETASAYFDLTRSIDSDSQMMSVLSSFIASPSISDTRIGQAIKLGGEDIDSDSQLNGLLQQAAARVGASDALAQTYLGAVRSIDSDSQSASALQALADTARLSPASWRTLLEVGSHIGSDSQKSGLLTSVAARLPRQPDIVAAYRSAVQTIGSDSARRPAEQALN
jgi:beta-lactamase regulating signal transducer with metallopeptidase domain